MLRIHLLKKYLKIMINVEGPTITEFSPYCFVIILLNIHSIAFLCDVRNNFGKRAGRFICLWRDGFPLLVD
jgi:hypothetical protein